MSRGVRPTTWERSLKNWELPFPCFVEFFSGKGTHWDSSLPVSLTLWDTPALFTGPTSPSPSTSESTPISGAFSGALLEISLFWSPCQSLTAS